MPRFNLLLGLGFTAIADDPNGETLTPSEIRAAIQSRLETLPDTEILEAVLPPQDCYPET